jgi:hypothetical protein
LSVDALTTGVGAQVAMATKKTLISIKGISEVKAEKMLKAAREMVNVGFTTVRAAVPEGSLVLTAPS